MLCVGFERFHANYDGAMLVHHSRIETTSSSKLPRMCFSVDRARQYRPSAWSCTSASLPRIGAYRGQEMTTSADVSFQEGSSRSPLLDRAARFGTRSATADGCGNSSVGPLFCISWSRPVWLCRPLLPWFGWMDLVVPFVGPVFLEDPQGNASTTSPRPEG